MADAPENDVAELLSPKSAPVRSLITPNVRREVRDFFGCDTLAGAELEDDGGTGTVNKHFETRLFQVLFLHHHGSDGFDTRLESHTPCDKFQRVPLLSCESVNHIHTKKEGTLLRFFTARPVRIRRAGRTYGSA
jgi:hypothetical protein